MSQITESEIKSMTKEQNYMRGYADGKSDVLDKIRAEIEIKCSFIKEDHCRYCSYCNCVMGVREILEIINKYKAESEDQNVNHKTGDDSNSKQH